MLFYILYVLGLWFQWSLTYNDPMYLVKKNKPKGKPNAGWVDNGEWKE